MARIGTGGASVAPSSGAASRRCSCRSTLAASRPRRRQASPSPALAIACQKARSSASSRAAHSSRSRSISACCMRLRELGVTVWNDARAIERCVDKSTTTFFLQRAGIPTPRTFARVNRPEVEQIASSLLAEGRKLVQKPLFGAQGKGLTPDCLARRSLLARGGERGLLSPGVHRARARAPSGLASVRMPGPRHRLHDQARIKLDHQYQAGRPRQGGDRQPGAGGSRAARRHLRRRRLCRGRHHPGRDGRFFVLEVNSMPAWNGLQLVSHIRISDHLVDAFLDAALPPARREGQEGT